MDDAEAPAQPAGRDWTLVPVCGVLVAGAAVYERIWADPPRTYFLCDRPASLDHIAWWVTGLIAAALAAGVVGGVLTARSSTSSLLRAAAYLLVAVALVVTADGLDHRGAVTAARAAGATCDEPEQYDVTPGWFYWSGPPARA